MSDSTELPPGPDPLPIVGNTHQLLTNELLDWSTSLADTYGDVVRLEVATKTIILLSDPEAIEKVLVKESEKYTKSGFQKHVTSSLLGTGIVLAEGDSWRTQRRALEPAFHPERMERFRERIEMHASRQLAQWEDGELLRFEDEMKELTLAIIADTLFDIDIRNESWGLKPAFSRILEHFERIAQTYLYVPERIPTPENRAYRSAVADLEDVVDRIITKHETNDESKPTLVTRLVNRAEEGDDWDRDAIRDEIVTLLLAGHETTALTLTFAGYLLGTHPTVHDRTTTVVDEFDDDEFVLEATNCTQIERILEETFRLYPPVYAIFREPIRDVTVSGYRVPEGATIALNQWVVHRSGDIFDDPAQFRPSRWTDEFRSRLSPGEFFPFGAGPRRCIGERLAMLEGTIVLGKLLADYELEAVSDSLEPTPSLTTQPKNQLVVRITERT